LLAAISHDLQIPLTRLRLEEVGDGPPRERLTQDVQAMQILVREGLDLAAPPMRARTGRWSTLIRCSPAWPRMRRNSAAR